MVVANTSSAPANLSAFPTRDAGYLRLVRLLARLGGSSATWTGSQSDLAEHLHVDVRTVRRWLKQARDAHYLTTNGKNERLTYCLLAVPSPADPDRTPRPIRPEVVSGGADIRSGGEDIDRSGGADIQVQPSRGRDPLSSSSSSDSGHEDPDLADPDPGDRSGGGDIPPPGDRTLTARGELFVVFHVAQPTEQTAEEWAALDQEGRAFAAKRYSTWPSTKDRDDPPPALIEAIVHTATERMAAVALTAELPTSAYEALLDDVAPAPQTRSTAKEAGDVAGPMPPRLRSHAPRPARSLLHRAVGMALLVGIDMLSGGRR